MFGGEYLYRVMRHRDFPHASIMKGVQMFNEHKPLSDSAPSARNLSGFEPTDS
jgi:hypothetical protein